MAHHWPKELLICQGTVLFGPDSAVNYDYIITNSINKLAQGVFPMAHILTIVKPIWPMLQNISKTPVNRLINILIQ